MEEPTIRDILESERVIALHRVREMQSDLDGIIAASVDANADDEHDPEGSTIAFERAQVTALVAEAQANVDELDRALLRLTAGSYAMCHGCGKQIAPERLAARPAARTCFDCATAQRPGATLDS